MNKYYFQTVYRLESGLTFEDHETMIEYVRDNWEAYCRPIGDEVKLVSLQDLDNRIIFTYREREIENGEIIADSQSEEWLDYTTENLVWMISKLERMTANV